MHAIAIMLSIITMVAFITAAVPKLTRSAAVTTALTRLEIRRAAIPRIGAVEIVGALGLLVGIIWADWLATLTACFLTIMMIIAVQVHRRAGDRGAELGPAVLYLVLSALTFITLLFG